MIVSSLLNQGLGHYYSGAPKTEIVQSRGENYQCEANILPHSNRQETTCFPGGRCLQLVPHFESARMASHSACLRRCGIRVWCRAARLTICLKGSNEQLKSSHAFHGGMCKESAEIQSSNTCKITNSESGLDEPPCVGATLQWFPLVPQRGLSPCSTVQSLVAP